MGDKCISPFTRVGENKRQMTAWRRLFVSACFPSFCMDCLRLSRVVSQLRAHKFIDPICLSAVPGI